MPAAADSPVARVRQWLLAQWFKPHPSPLSRVLGPWAWVYGWLQRRSRATQERLAQRLDQPHCAVVVVGNLIVGGAGKTPTTLAVVKALRDAGHSPGVVSRGYGRQGSQVLDVSAQPDPAAVGDEPLLIHRRGAVPVVVGRDRVAAARHLLQAHPQVNVIVSDDGLQHRQLRRDVEVIVFDERGIGNGRLLPAGPLREPFALAPPAGSLVLYNHAAPSTAWPGWCAARQLGGACLLQDWLNGALPALPLAHLQGRPLLAMAGLAVPERFFAALEAAGLSITRLPLPDHHAYGTAPWPPGTTEVITTEKDAVKLGPMAGGTTTLWVVGLDLDLPPAFIAKLLERLTVTHGRRTDPLPATDPARETREP